MDAKMQLGVLKARHAIAALTDPTLAGGGAAEDGKAKDGKAGEAPAEEKKEGG